MIRRSKTVELSNWAVLLGKNLEFKLTNDIVTIGRNQESTIFIEEKRLSGLHARITRIGEEVTITDLSTNGTYLNDVKIGKN